MNIRNIVDKEKMIRNISFLKELVIEESRD